MQSAQHKINWWLIIGGVALTVCGIVIFADPVLFLGYFTVCAGVGFLVSGIMGIASYIQLRRYAPSAPFHLFMAILDIIAGIMLVMHPFVYADLLPWLLGASFIAFGVVEIIGLIPYAQLVPETRPVAIISGLMCIVVGLMFIIMPASLSLWVATFALIRGITLIAMGFTARK